MHAASPGAGGSKAAAERDQVERLRAFLQQHARLADCHTNVFFTEQLWYASPCCRARLSVPLAAWLTPHACEQENCAV